MFVMNNFAKLNEVVKKCANSCLVDYLQMQCCKLMENNNIREVIYSVLPYGSEEENIDHIFHIVNEISKNKIIVNY